MSIISCRNLTIQFNEIKSLRNQLSFCIENKQPAQALEIQPILQSKLTELQKTLWPCEILTKSEIIRQLNEWKNIYAEFGIDVTLPSEKDLLAYLAKDPTFAKLLAEKEKQGFTQMVIAPLNNTELIEKIGYQIQSRGGTVEHPSDFSNDLKNENHLKYFRKINHNKFSGGFTINQIRSDPSAFNILNDNFISFTKPRQNILKADSEEVIDSTGRSEIKAGLKAQEYQDKYFSGTDTLYAGEHAMIPQEWLALFAKDFFEKYIQPDHRFYNHSYNNLMDSTSITWFISISGTEQLVLSASWEENHKCIVFLGHRLYDSDWAAAPPLRSPQTHPATFPAYAPLHPNLNRFP